MTTNDSNISSKKYFFNFNQNFTSLAVGTSRGFRIYHLNTVDSLDVIHDSSKRGTEPAKAPETAKEFTDCYILERLFSTSLVVLVSIQFPRKLKVYHFKKGSEICNYSYSNTILSVKLNRYRLVVCLEENLHIHNLKDMKCLHTIRDTPPNPNGLMALSADENCYIAYPVSCSAGEVQIFDGKNLQNKLMIPAHNSPLAAMAFDNSGRMLATASEKGTVIRVFSLADSTKLFELRRGVIRNASIYSLTFSCNDKYLCTSSNTETVHIFKLDHQAEPPPDDGGYWSFMGRVFREGANMLPYPMTEMWKQERSFATALVPSSQCRKVATIASIGGETRVLVATEDGYLYIFNLDTYMGGVCSLERTHKLDENVEMVDPPDVSSLEPPLNNPGELSSIGDVSASPVYNLNDDNDFPPMTHNLE